MRHLSNICYFSFLDQNVHKDWNNWTEENRNSTKNWQLGTAKVPVWSSVHTNPWRKRSYSKTLFKPEEFKTPASHLSMDGKDFENGAFRERGDISLPEFYPNTNAKWPVIECVFKFLQHSADETHLIRFQSKNSNSLVNSFVHDTMCCGSAEWTSCDLMTAFQHPPIIVRPRVPANGANPTSFGGKLSSTPPRCAPHVFDVTWALTWIPAVTNVACVTQLVTGKRFYTIRTREYPVSMEIGGIRHCSRLVCKD